MRGLTSDICYTEQKRETSDMGATRTVGVIFDSSTKRRRDAKARLDQLVRDHLVADSYKRLAVDNEEAAELIKILGL